MDNVTLKLDVVAAEDATWDTGAGLVTVTIVDQHGPGGQNPVAKLTGEPPALLAWLLNEYVSSLDEALDLMRTPVERGGALVGARQ